MTLRHVKRAETGGGGSASWRLLDANEQPISVFDEFCRSMSGAAFSTRQRYAIVVSRFVDYLYEVGVLGREPVTRRVINEAIDYYLLLLRDGDGVVLGQVAGNGTVRYEPGEQDREDGLRRVASRLGIKPLSPNSWSNTIAALNGFLRLCTMLENEAREIALVKGGLDRAVTDASAVDYKPLLEAVDGCKRLSHAEALHIKHATMLGGVVRFRGGDLQRPRGLSGPRKRGAQRDVQVLDFPMERFRSLLDAATSWRDRAFWTLLAASGIRQSEALNLEWHHIDFERETVYVLDPEFTRYGRDLPEHERVNRFKGRTVSWTYLRLPYRTWFFELLLKYRQHEYVLPADGNDFVFQYVIHPYRGRPLREAADSTLNDSFTGAVVRAEIPGPPMLPGYVWTRHSLRHAYGMFMLNDLEIPGQSTPGLTEAEVQLLMGHADIHSTRKYAKPREARLRQKLEMHERCVLPVEQSLAGLPPPIAARLAKQIGHWTESKT